MSLQFRGSPWIFILRTHCLKENDRASYLMSCTGQNVMFGYDWSWMFTEQTRTTYNLQYSAIINLIRRLKDDIKNCYL